MRKVFICSLIHNGILGGAIYLDQQSVTYRTNKLTVDPKIRNLTLPLQDIDALTWKRMIFPVATFRMKNGEEYRFLIFNQARFCRAFEEFKQM